MTDSPFQAPALHVLWQAVTFDPMDFQCWTALLSQVESVGFSADAHRAYDEFLRQFPLCFGYWKKYANLARRHPAPPTAAAASTSTGGAAEHTPPSTTSLGGHEERRGVDGGAGGGGESLSPEARQARGVYERAVSAAPFCLELWEAFVGDVMGEGGGVGEGIGVGKGGGGGGGGGGRAADVRRVFERALEAVGDNPGAGPLWRRCVAFEEAQAGLRGPLRVTRLYERAFGHRLKDLEVLWIGFKEFVDGIPWDNLRPPPPPPPPPSATSSATAEGKSTAAAAAAAAEGDDAVGDDDDFEVAEAALTVASSAEEGSTDADKKAMLVRILGEKRKSLRIVLQASLRGRQRRESFERGISRPHFHVKPLDDAQLLAWSQYLDFEQAQAAGAERGRSEGLSSAVATPGRKRRRGGGEGENGNGGSGSNNGRGSRGNGDVERLFERCLVPCASYSWFWERYALWKESVWGLESALEVAERACSPFLRWRPEALFFKAELLERVGRKEEARNVYQHVLSEVAPGLVEGACKLACFERRCGNREAASAAYRSLLPPPLGLPAGGGGGEKGVKSSHWKETTETTRPYLYMQLARFQQRVLGNPSSARATFRAAVDDIPGSRELWLAFLEFEAAQPQALHAGRVEAAFRMAIGDGGGGTGAGGAKNNSGEENDDDDARRLTVEDRADLWEWFEEFVEDLCMDVAKVMSVRAEHRAWTRAHGTGAHEAAAATAAAGEAASAASGSAVDPPQASRSSDRGNANSNVTASTGPVTRTGTAPANPHRPINATAAGGGTRSYAGNPGVSLDPASAGGAMIGVAGDQQRRNEWSAYCHQQQQQQHVMGVSVPPSTGAREAVPSGGAAHSATFGQGPSSWSLAMMEPAAAGAWGALPANAGLPIFVPGGAGAGAATLYSQQLQQLQQHQIDVQVQNQQEMRQGGSDPPPSRTAAARPARMERLG